MELQYNVKYIRGLGLEARWGRTRTGGPCMFVRNPASTLKHQRETWWLLTNSMWERAKVAGLVAAFDEHTLLGNIFSISA